MQNWQRMAADRLTQLQDAVNLQAENFCNSIGVLQILAKESSFPEFNVNKLPTTSSNNSTTVVDNSNNNGSDCNNSNNNNNNNNNNSNNKNNNDSNIGSSTKSELSKTCLSSSSKSSTSLSNTVSLLNGTSSTSGVGGSNIGMTSPSSKPSNSILRTQQLDNNKDEKMKKSQQIPITTSNMTDLNTTNKNSQQPQQDNIQLFARMIARTAKDIDTLIESLPTTFETESGSSDLHSRSIRQLEDENKECISRLEEVIKLGESMLEKIQNALDEIALMQLKSQSLEGI